MRSLLARLLATHGPMTLDDIRARYGLPEAVLQDALQHWAATQQGVVGRLLPDVAGTHYCDRRNLEQAHRRTLSILRREIQPVPLSTYVDFLARWQHVHPQGRLHPPEALPRAIQQLRALPVPALLWERDLLPARVAGLRPAELEALCQSGEVVWVGSGAGRSGNLRACLLFRGEGAAYLPTEPAPEGLASLNEGAAKVLGLLRSEGACFTRDLETGTGLRGQTLTQALLELVAAGLVTNDSWRALRELVRFRLGGDVRRPLSSLEAQLAERLPGPR
ncbi:MAG: Lhr family ATP-dependent helicase, partial [Anaerolineae bacterium]